MRVKIAAVVCLVALVRAGSASAYAGSADNSRALAASICAEPARVVEVMLPGEAVGGERAERFEHVERGARENADEGNTLWCVSPEDPRCAPLESSSHENLSFARAKLGCAVSNLIDRVTARELASGSSGCEYRGSARDGVLEQLERPPN